MSSSGIFSICKNEPLLMRQYQIIHGGKPLIFIEEQFPYNRFLDERRVIIRTPSRIHVTLLDMNGGLGRVDGGIGIALDDPSILLEAQASPSLEVHGCDSLNCTADPGVCRKRARQNPCGKQRINYGEGTLPGPHRPRGRFASWRLPRPGPAANCTGSP